MPQCSVKDCTTYDKTEYTLPNFRGVHPVVGVRLFCVPDNRRQAWADALQIEVTNDFSDREWSNIRVCSRHFSIKQYFVNYLIRLAKALRKPSKRGNLLLPTAIPDQCLPGGINFDEDGTDVFDRRLYLAIRWKPSAPNEKNPYLLDDINKDKLSLNLSNDKVEKKNVKKENELLADDGVSVRPIEFIVIKKEVDDGCPTDDPYTSDNFPMETTETIFAHAFKAAGVKSMSSVCVSENRTVCATSSSMVNPLPQEKLMQLPSSYRRAENDETMSDAHARATKYYTPIQNLLSADDDAASISLSSGCLKASVHFERLCSQIYNGNMPAYSQKTNDFHIFHNCELVTSEFLRDIFLHIKRLTDENMALKKLLSTSCLPDTSSKNKRQRIASLELENFSEGVVGSDLT